MTEVLTDKQTSLIIFRFSVHLTVVTNNNKNNTINHTNVTCFHHFMWPCVKSKGAVITQNNIYIKFSFYKSSKGKSIRLFSVSFNLIFHQKHLELWMKIFTLLQCDWLQWYYSSAHENLVHFLLNILNLTQILKCTNLWFIGPDCPALWKNMLIKY